MATEKQWIIWLSQSAGTTFLGLSDTDVNSRFCIVGRMKEDYPGIGVWVQVDVVQERTIPGNAVVKEWRVKPPTCLIRWDDITHMQRGSVSSEIGFTPK